MKHSVTLLAKKLRKVYLDNILDRRFAALSSSQSLFFIMGLLYGPVLQTWRPNLGCAGDAFSRLKHVQNWGQ